MHKVLLFISVLYILTSCSSSPTYSHFSKKLPNSLIDKIICQETEMNNLRMFDGVHSYQTNSFNPDSVYIVTYFPYFSCSSCIEKELALLKHTIGDNSNSAICICKFSSNRERGVFEKNCGIKTYRVISESNLLKDCDDIIAMFVLYKNKAWNVIDLESENGVSEAYYNWFNTILQL